MVKNEYLQLKVKIIPGIRGTFQFKFNLQRIWIV